MQPLPNIDELLTGLLDGNLSQSELRQVEAAMAADSTLEKQLETLRKMRSDLLIHRPKGRLGADFAKRVTAMAEERSRATAPHLAPVVVPKLRLAPWIYSGVASAAVLACIFLAMPSDSNEQPLIANVNLPVDIPAATPEQIPAVGALESQLNVTESKIANGTVRKPNSPIVIKELEQTNSLASVLPPSQNDDSKNDDTVKKDSDGGATAKANPATPSVASKSKANQSNEQIMNEARAKLKASNLAENFYTMVIQLTLSKDAIENRTLEAILSRHNIASTEDQILTPEEFSSLEKTGLAGKASGDGAGEIGLVFVRAPGTNIYGAILEMYREQLSFPDISLGMQYDSSLKFLGKELSSIRVVAEEKGVSRRIRSNTEDSLMPFSAGSQKLLSIERKGEQSGMSVILKAESRAMSNTILIIRAAK